MSAFILTSESSLSCWGAAGTMASVCCLTPVDTDGQLTSAGRGLEQECFQLLHSAERAPGINPHHEPNQCTRRRGGTARIRLLQFCHRTHFQTKLNNSLVRPREENQLHFDVCRSIKKLKPATPIHPRQVWICYFVKMSHTQSWMLTKWAITGWRAPIFSILFCTCSPHSVCRHFATLS